MSSPDPYIAAGQVSVYVYLVPSAQWHDQSQLFIAKDVHRKSILHDDAWKRCSKDVGLEVEDELGREVHTYLPNSVDGR
jgi:hypothetical protein